MKDFPNEANKMNCDTFLSELEALAPGNFEELLARLPVPAREHIAQCASCREALNDLAETRAALAPMRAALPRPGPWFVTRVLNAIAAREREIEERKNSVWVGVRRFAPRLAALACVILVVGGTWAFQLRRADRLASQTRVTGAESLFEPGTSMPVNDDIVGSVNGGQQQ
jgi:hypothetical protein